MNERIRELKQRAIDYVDGVDDGLGIEQYREFVDQKFAELIIKETLQIARVGMEFGPSMDEAVYTYFGLGMSTEDKKNLIKELLGVKE